MDLMFRHGMTPTQRLMWLKRLTGGGIPSGYLKLDYITFNGNAYISTNKSIKKNRSWEAKFRKSSDSGAYLYALANNGNTTTTTAYLTSNSGSWRFGDKYVGITIEKDIWYESIQDVTGVTINGTKTAYSNVGSFSSGFTYEIYLGCGRTYGNSYNPSSFFVGDVAYFKIKDDGVLIRDYVPVLRLSDGVYGFYDKVSGRFFPSRGDPFTGYKEGLKVVSGSLVHVEDALAKPLVIGAVTIEPVQSGDGDPSPDNARPITGHTGCEFYHSGADTSNPTTIPITFPDSAGTVYGGTLNVITGVLTLTKYGIDLSSFEWQTRYTGSTNKVLSVILTDYLTDDLRPSYAKRSNYILEQYVYNGYVTSYDKLSNPDTRNVGLYIYHGESSGEDVTTIYLVIPTDQTPAGMFVYDLNSAYPTEPIQLTPHQIQMLLGENNVWSDQSSVEITYYAQPDSDDLNAADSLNLLLGNSYTRGDVPDEEALQIIMGETT